MPKTKKYPLPVVPRGGIVLFLPALQLFKGFLEFVEAEHGGVGHEQAHDHGAHGVVPHHRDLQYCRCDEQRQHRHDQRHHNRQDVGGQLGEQVLDHFHDDVGHEDQPGQNGHQNGSVMDDQFVVHMYPP